MTTNETPGPSGTVPDQYLEDISADELYTNVPADETDTNKDARRERYRKRNERRRVPSHPEPRGSTRPSREPGAHHPRAMPHVYHYDSTSGSGDARGTSQRQARGGRLLHASRQQGHSSAPIRNRQQDNEATSRSADIGRNRT
jgi:hypothetical protein